MSGEHKNVFLYLSVALRMKPLLYIINQNNEKKTIFAKRNVFPISVYANNLALKWTENVTMFV